MMTLLLTLIHENPILFLLIAMCGTAFGAAFATLLSIGTVAVVNLYLQTKEKE